MSVQGATIDSLVTRLASVPVTFVKEEEKKHDLGTNRLP